MNGTWFLWALRNVSSLDKLHELYSVCDKKPLYVYIILQ